MAMLDSSRAQIQWELSGQLASFNVTIPVTSVFELNQLTGRVISHTCVWLERVGGWVWVYVGE
jgi:hypothetical protein